MIIAENIQILETSLCPPCCKKETVEKFIAALQYKNFLEKEQKKNLILRLNNYVCLLKTK